MVSKSDLKKKMICVVGLGYIGMPLAEAFSKHFKVVGFDVDEKKIDKLKNNYSNLELTSTPSKIKEADFIIIAVPTPVTKSKEPNLAFIESASRIVGQNLKKGAIVVLESTVYPGVTEEIVGPVLEKESGLRLGKDFKIGYSPERVNPGDNAHTIDKITKIVSGMDKESTNKLAELYGNITSVFKAADIKTAEAAKVIENVQRDLNIALINELSIVFSKINIDIKAVLDAASTKWNFHRYEPGLVGGHCIPVDPYYLVYKAKELGYHPRVILAGRSVNDSMPKHVVDLTVKALNEINKVMNGSKILLMGLTFKENVDDMRETPSLEIIKELLEYKCEIYVYDPLLNKKNVDNLKINYLKVNYLKDLNIKVDCIIVTVAHDIFKSLSLDDLIDIKNGETVLIDIRRIYDSDEAKKRGFKYIYL